MKKSIIALLVMMAVSTESQAQVSPSSLFRTKPEKKLTYFVTDQIYVFSVLRNRRPLPRPRPPKWGISKAARPYPYVGIGLAF